MGSCLVRYRLSGRTDDNTPEYGFKDCEFLARVVSVYDGDTCTAVVRINGRYQKIKVRCYGYDSPELRPPRDCVNRDEVILSAEAAKSALVKYCLHKTVRLKIHGFDKYGRFLGTLYRWQWFRKIDINKCMIDNGFGYEYFGGKKDNRL